MKDNYADWLRICLIYSSKEPSWNHAVFIEFFEPQLDFTKMFPRLIEFIDCMWSKAQRVLGAWPCFPFFLHICKIPRVSVDP